ncbi:MAG: tetratricopeptide repeat protein [Pseudomonadales bacterium]|nr:tetratricopeptide repeat protein [Pseudomonadales bacterium]
MAEPASYIVDVNETNINDVLQQSMQTPVLLDFWASWCEPCKTLGPILEKLANEYQGKFILAKIDSDASPAIAQQLGVRGLPTLKLVVQGQLVNELTGAQPEASIREMLEPHVGPAGEQEDDADAFLQQVQRAREMGAYDQAIEALQAALQEQPERWEYHLALVDVLIDADRIDDAKQVVDAIKDDKTKNSALVKLSFLDWLKDAPDPQTVQEQLQQDPENLDARFYYALHLIMAGHEEPGLDLLLDIMRKDRSFRDDGAKEALLKAFDLIGSGNPAVSKYRRKLFALLH